MAPEKEIVLYVINLTNLLLNYVNTHLERHKTYEYKYEFSRKKNIDKLRKFYKFTNSKILIL